MTQPQESLLHVAEVCARTTFSRATIYAKVGAGEFPKPVKISANRIAWPESAVAGWIAAKIGEAA